MSPLLFEDKARKQWDLDRLYDDLGKAKHEAFINRPSALTDVEKELLCGLLLKLSPAEIARRRKSASVTPYLSDTIYRYVEQLTGKFRNSLKSWRDVPDWLEEAGYRTKPGTDDLGQMPEVTTFYGRQVELGQLRNRVSGQTPCRLVAIIGHAGMGKTSLAVTLVDALRHEFVGDHPFTGKYIWQSLRYAPSLNHVLGHWLTRMPSVKSHSDAWYDQLNAVMAYFRTHRCFVVIDNLESILDANNLSGYRQDYLPYQEFFKRLGEEQHQSCVVVTSRYRTQEINGFADSPIQHIELQGLYRSAAEELLATQGLSPNTREHWNHLTSLYRGNPLMLKMAAQYIVELFDGDVSRFLRCARTILSRDLRALVGQLLSQLSKDEKDVLKQLVETDRPIPIEAIQNPQRMDAVSTLLSRCLIEKSADGVTPIPVVEDYIRNFEPD